jgi:hypothetical protein
MPTLKIILNGTDENPFHRMGLTQNPFPQLAKAEWDAATLRLQSLAGDPIPNTDYIRERLDGFFVKEFIDMCCDRFVKGEKVEFHVNWKESE